MCNALANPAARQREITALQAAMKELGLSEATLVTREESEQIIQKNGNIEIIPVWKFLPDERLR